MMITLYMGIYCATLKVLEKCVGFLDYNTQNSIKYKGAKFTFLEFKSFQFIYNNMGTGLTKSRYLHDGRS